MKFMPHLMFAICLCAAGAVTSALAATEEPVPQDIPATAQPGRQVSEEEAQNEPSGPEQTVYPGITNMQLQRGGGEQPSISVYFPVFGKPVVDKIITSFIHGQIAEYEQEITDSIVPGEEKPASFSMWDMSGFYTIERPRPDIVSVIFNIYSYSGGAHGSLLIRCLNFDLENDRQLELNDLVARPDEALKIFSTVSARRLHADLAQDADEEMIRSGTEPAANNFANLSLMPWGLYVEFQPYQVGPWSIGAQRVGISLRDLAPAEPNKAIWPTEVEPPASLDAKTN